MCTLLVTMISIVESEVNREASTTTEKEPFAMKKWQIVGAVTFVVIAIYIGKVGVSVLMSATSPSPLFEKRSSTETPFGNELHCLKFDNEDRHAINLKRLTLLYYIRHGKKRELRIIKEIAGY